MKASAAAMVAGSQPLVEFVERLRGFSGRCRRRLAPTNLETQRREPYLLGKRVCGWEVAVVPDEDASGDHHRIGR
jgi:hypothetical protein